MHENVNKKCREGGCNSIGYVVKKMWLG